MRGCCVMQSRACIRLFATSAVLFSCFLCQAHADDLQSFISPIGLDGLRMALRDSEQQSKTQLAADTISQTFAKADRSDIDLIAITEQRDAGPPIQIGSDTLRLPSVAVFTSSETSTIGATPMHKNQAARAEKPIGRLASLRLPARESSPQVESVPDTDRKPLALSSMQPLLSSCGPMTPVCLANKAWCGC